ncbi:MAG: LD-carboxypeptidase [Synechococcales bacterium]|nr:LD-carboxypeptidase [Synechococcales bacterium]
MELCHFPPPLQPGDLLLAIAPSGALRETNAFEQGLELWRSQGYRVETVAGYDDRWGYLAGTDAGRRSQLTFALKQPACRGILCVRGGWGGARILEEFVFPPQDDRNPPKWLVGFSDITSLLWAYGQQGIAGLHAPLLTTIAQEPDWSRQRLFNLVQGQFVQGNLLEPLTGNGWGGGTVEGILLPANLTVATHLLNTPYEPDLSNVILALEDIGEAPYRIDRLLTHWRMTGALGKVRGIALGRFSLCDPPVGIPSFSVEEVLRDRLDDLGIPIVSDLPFGHEGENGVLPVGRRATLDSDRGWLAIN